MNTSMKKWMIVFGLMLVTATGQAEPMRDRVLFDAGWHFAFGHSFDKIFDFGSGTSYFSYLSKSGYGDGAAAVNFDHRAWRPVDLPHDWAVEVPFDPAGSHSHGYKAVGPGFPETSVGWYRKTFEIPERDFGRQIFIDFDGVSRDAKVWVNGHYLGHEPSGYQSVSYNITDILNYGGENVVAVRADVSMEEGWYYEGAGIYRHVWMRKTSELHIPKDGTFVHSLVKGNDAEVTVETAVMNRGHKAQVYTLYHQVLDREGRGLAGAEEVPAELKPMESGAGICRLSIANPTLWSLEDPCLYTLLTQVIVEGKVVDEFRTPFGIRTIRFDPDHGFFLNGKPVKLKGTNNHQDHAGVGCALPDELIRWRLQQLKDFGCNAYRSSHNPPTPALLDLCDEMGILVIDENRLMGTTEHALHEVERLIKRDRNHPSVIVWSLGNEEWAIEGNEAGARITQTMQDFAHRIDPSRPVNVAVSGGWDNGIGSVVEIMGYNYLVHGDTDEHHDRFPDQPSIGTEEGSTFATRGIYLDDDEKQYKAAYDVKPRPDWFSIEEGWTHYADRDYLSGMFIWTGFDYRGEPTPYAWPSVISYFGMMDLCGFPKDNVYYLKAWWQDEPVLHILPHWNWPDRLGQPIPVWIYSNCEEVELFLNDESMGRKKMPSNGHLEWSVFYTPGILKAVGLNNGSPVLETRRITTGPAHSIKLSSHQRALHADGRDLAVITVEVLDQSGNPVPTADADIRFMLEGEGRIIGVGNGDPTSHEKERFVDQYNIIDLPELAPDALSATFIIDQPIPENARVSWYYRHVGKHQDIYLNGRCLKQDVMPGDEVLISLNASDLHIGGNSLLVQCEPFVPKHEWDHPNRQPGKIQLVTPAPAWHRKLFNGLAQVIVQSTRAGGELVLKAAAPGLKDAELILESK